MPQDRQRPAAIDYDVEISGVHEVSLVGDADLEFWRERLAPEGFTPVPAAGRAEVMVSATDARFHGIPFRELSFSVFVSREKDAEAPEGVYLVQAFNSVRFFAFVERTFFSTPYQPAELLVRVGPPAEIELKEKGGRPFAVTMAPRALGLAKEDGWEGPVFLPRKEGAARKRFYARLRGETIAASFDPSRDTLDVEPSARHAVFRWLLESRFTPREWILRPDATHGKSKTTAL